MIAISLLAAIGIPVFIWGAVLTWNHDKHYPVVAGTMALLFTIALMAIHLTPGPVPPPPQPTDYLPTGK